MNLLRTFQLAAAAVSVVLAGCGSAAAPGATSQPVTTPSASTAIAAPKPASGVGAAAFTAEVNGAAWSSGNNRASYQKQIFSLTGVDSSGSLMIITVGQVTAPGTYSLGYLNAGGSSVIFSNSSGHGWNSFLPGGTGTINITTLTPNRAAGTFSFEGAPAAGGASGTIRATNGKFDVTF